MTRIKYRDIIEENNKQMNIHDERSALLFLQSKGWNFKPKLIQAMGLFPLILLNTFEELSLLMNHVYLLGLVKDKFHTDKICIPSTFSCGCQKGGDLREIKQDSLVAMR